MANIKRCVTSYTTGYAELKVAFPNDEIACKHCPGCNKNDPDKDGVWKCMYLNGQSMNKADGKIGILLNCPIVFD